MSTLSVTSPVIPTILGAPALQPVRLSSLFTYTVPARPGHHRDGAVVCICSMNRLACKHPHPMKLPRPYHLALLLLAGSALLALAYTAALPDEVECWTPVQWAAVERFWNA